MAAEDLKQCPECAEEVKAAAAKCRFCGYRFDARTDIASEPGAAIPKLPVRVRWTWVGSVAFLILAIGVGVYFGAGQSPATAAADAYGKCKTQTAPVMTALQNLNSHLDVGINEA